MDRLIDADFDRKLLFNKKTTALLLGISTQAFSNWVIDPIERKGRETFYYWPDVLAERDARYYAEFEEGEEETPYLDLDQQRARHSKEQADKLALENAATREELVFVEHVGTIMSRAITSFRARLLASSSKLAPLVSPGNPNRARDLIEREHNSVLNQLSDFDPGTELEERKPTGKRSVRRTKAPSKADSKSVGGSRKKTKQRK